MSLQAIDVQFAYFGHQNLLRGIGLQLGEGKKIALTGPNGCGKTTLLQILSRKVDPDEGYVLGTEDVLLLEQHVPMGDQTVSGGELRLSALRRVFSSEAQILLLDEPTNDLDKNARRWFLDSVLRFKGAILIASHDPEILNLVDEIWELRNGKLLKHPPGFAEYIKSLEVEERLLRNKIDNFKSEAQKIELRAREVVERQQKRMEGGAKSAVKSNLPRGAQGAKKRQAERTLAKIKSVHEGRADYARERVLEAKDRLRQISLFEWDASKSRLSMGKRFLQLKEVRLDNFNRSLSLELFGPRRIHLKGKNGSGKSTLLRALCGDPASRARVKGDLYLASPFQLFDQQLSQFSSTMPLWEWFQKKTQLETSLARSVLGRLGFEQEEQTRPLSLLSGGERVRVEMAIVLHATKTPQTLLLDEPTNHLDIESRRILQSFVVDFQGALIVVSHDRAFISSLEFDTVIDLDEC